jgi:hypothetical protein
MINFFNKWLTVADEENSSSDKAERVPCRIGWQRQRRRDIITVRGQSYVSRLPK